jgi:hypothetical protein
VSAFKSPRATFTVASSGLQAILAGPWTDHAANRAEPNFRYVFEASADLAQWTKLAVRTNLTGTVNYTPPTSAAARRFYRVVVP